MLQAPSQALPFLALHVTVLLWGATAVLGKLVSYGSLSLVWHRMSLTCLAYCLVPGTLRSIWSMPGKDVAIFLGIGAVVCVHWVMFYTSIKLGDSASITLACCGSVSFFSAVLEPYVLRQPFSLRDLAVGVAVLAGILFIYVSLPPNPGEGEQKARNGGERVVHYEAAVFTGLLASFLGTVFTVLNKKYIQRAPSVVISTLEMASGALLLTVLTPLLSPLVYHENTVLFPGLDIHHLTLDKARDGPFDLIWVLILALFCTNITFFLSMYALKHLSAFTVNLTGNMEPVYGIVFGAVFFHENESLNANFYVGTGIILISIFASLVLDVLYPRSCPKCAEEAKIKAKAKASAASFATNSTRADNDFDTCQDEEEGLDEESNKMLELVGLLAGAEDENEENNS